MPAYDFKCEKCGYEFEQTIKMVDPNPPCPNPVEDPEGAGDSKPCGGPTKKLITASTFHLKGKGWASDGYS